MEPGIKTTRCLPLNMELRQTLLLQFAGLAMSGVIQVAREASPEDIARVSFKIADAMLAEFDKRVNS